MECPHCGEKITVGKECQECGKGVLHPKEMEIQYKEFKVSELLDIRMTSHVPSLEGMKKPEPAPEGGNGTTRPAQASKKPSGRRALLVVTAVIVLLAAVAGFYLLRFLF